MNTKLMIHKGDKFFFRSGAYSDATEVYCLALTDITEEVITKAKELSEKMHDLDDSYLYSIQERMLAIYVHLGYVAILIDKALMLDFGYDNTPSVYENEWFLKDCETMLETLRLKGW